MLNNVKLGMALSSFGANVNRRVWIPITFLIDIFGISVSMYQASSSNSDYFRNKDGVEYQKIKKSEPYLLRCYYCFILCQNISEKILKGI